MKLQDYAHYYIGAPCFNTWFTPDHDAYDAGWKLSGIRTDNEKCYMLENETDVTWVDRIALKLRRLEDMTEEEARFILDNYSFCSVDMPMNKKKFAIEIAKRLVKQMPVAHYLLTRHFDLFGLITAGLAVDIKTITP